MSAERTHPPPVAGPCPLLLAGPTAVGKSEIALRLAERVGGEIVSVDSMQVYRGMDIGTAKPSPAERARVPHHLLDVVAVTEPFDVAQFLDLARRVAADIQGRGRRPILCGGTGLYFKAFIEGLGRAPATDAALRAAIEATPLPELLRELAASDPATYERIDRKNPRRVIRAVEVIRLTGQPFSAQRADWPHVSRLTPHATLCIGLARSSDDLPQRIAARVDAMFRRGWVAETEHLLKQGLDRNRIAMQALGYRQIVEHLRGERSLPETVELIKARTRQFARRQRTWFRRQLPVTWHNLEPHTTPEMAVEALLHLLPSSPL